MGKNDNNKGISNKEFNMDDRMARSDDDNDNDDNDNTGIGRTYECSYCKRGFTNAQALGGHMNIHRKDKAKAKNPTFSSSSSISYKFDDNQVSPYSSTNMTNPQWNHQAYYNPIPNPRSSSQPSSYYGINNSSMEKSSLFGMYEHDLGMDLSLRINNSRNTHQEDQEKKDDNCEDDIDLELRLGYDP